MKSSILLIKYGSLVATSAGTGMEVWDEIANDGRTGGYDQGDQKANKAGRNYARKLKKKYGKK